jgi:hypothetical protein
MRRSFETNLFVGRVCSYVVNIIYFQFIVTKWPNSNCHLYTGVMSVFPNHSCDLVSCTNASKHQPSTYFPATTLRRTIRGSLLFPLFAHALRRQYVLLNSRWVEFTTSKLNTNKQRHRAHNQKTLTQQFQFLTQKTSY